VPAHSNSVTHSTIASQTSPHFAEALPRDVLAGEQPSVVLQAWDMVPGLDFPHEMQKATTTAKRTLAVLSPAYFTSQFSEAEWRVAFADDPSGEQRRLIPVRVIDFKPAGLLATRIYIDLVGKDRQAARTALYLRPQMRQFVQGSLTAAAS
jgi:hypothetical protein